MTLPTLVLDSYMFPHAVRSWEAVITAFYKGTVEILSEYDEVVYRNDERDVTIRKPAVARLIKPTRRFKKGVKFSRVNVMTRDNCRCQYCGAKLPMDSLTYDHVLPRKRGGKTVWNNIATACKPCNGVKGSRTPEEAGMPLKQVPFKPKVLPLAAPLIALREDVPEEWKPYLPLTA